MTIAHTGIITNPSSHTALLAWYTAALAPLGYAKAISHLNDLVVGFQDTNTGNVDWWVSSAAARPDKEGVGEMVPLHTAFAAKDRATVEAFHKAAVEAGGKDNGLPGLRAYAPNYYAAFVLDPAGNNIEVVCMAPE